MDGQHLHEKLHQTSTWKVLTFDSWDHFGGGKKFPVANLDLGSVRGPFKVFYFASPGSSCDEVSQVAMVAVRDLSFGVDEVIVGDSSEKG